MLEMRPLHILLMQRLGPWRHLSLSPLSKVVCLVTDATTMGAGVFRCNRCFNVAESCMNTCIYLQSCWHLSICSLIPWQGCCWTFSVTEVTHGSCFSGLRAAACESPGQPIPTGVCSRHGTLNKQHLGWGMNMMSCVCQELVSKNIL
jgi:hypothetical protein